MNLQLKQFSAKILLTALIATIYAVATLALGSLGYSFIQIRISEALTPLPFSMGLPAVMGLTIGCLLANLYSPIGLIDIVFGSLLTFLAALMSWKLNFGSKFLACLYPIIINAFGVSVYITIFFGIQYFISVAAILVGESIAVLLVGYPLLIAIDRYYKKTVLTK